MVSGKHKGSLVIRGKGLRGEPFGWTTIPVIGADRVGYVRDRAAMLGISERELCQRFLLDRIDTAIRMK